MRFLIVTTDYSEFLRWLYAQHPGLEKKPYEEQLQVRNESLFGMADFYSSNLRKLGYEAWDVYANNEWLQKAWARENGICIKEPAPLEKCTEVVLQNAHSIFNKAPLRYLKPFLRPILSGVGGQQRWFYEILAAQIKHCRPDILLNHAMSGISSCFLKEMNPYVRLLIGQHAANQLDKNEDWSVYDLVISSFPPTLEWFRSKGMPAELNRLGFEPRILSYISNTERKIPVSFVGSFHHVHSTRIQWLEYLCSTLKVKIWSPDLNRLSASSAIRRSYAGTVWGTGMYQVLQDSFLTLNHHGNIPPYANNCRLYEATGVGTLLLTDWKANLHEMFEPGKEVVTYRTPEECAELIQYYLEHYNERETIARAGQQRTLREHTYYQRMQKLVDIVRKYM